MSNPSARPAFTSARARPVGQRGLLPIVSLLLLGGALAVGRPAPARANTTSTAATVPPGMNLRRGHDSRLADRSGLPTVVRYGTAEFP